MRTNIEIDDQLLRQVMKITGAPSKKGAVESALHLIVQLHHQRQALEKLWGIGWEGNLEKMRENEHLDWDSTWNTDSTRDKSVA